MRGENWALPAQIYNSGVDIRPTDGCPRQLLHPLYTEMTFVQNVE